MSNRYPTHTDFLWNWFVIVWERLGLVAHPDHYTVTLWGSHPDAGNDDAWTGDHFAHKIDALAARENVLSPAAHGLGDHHGLARSCTGWAFIEITGPDIHEVHANPDRKAVARAKREAERSNREWQHERAMQAGMAFGCDGYNDEMGY